MEWLQTILKTDTELFLYLNSFHTDFWDTVMLMVTRKETWIPFFAIIVFWFFKNYRSKAVFILFFLALTIVASDQFSVLLKETVQRLRPVYNSEIEHLVHNVLRKGSQYGFVSSHAANSFAILTFTALIFKNRYYTWLLLFWAVLFSYSRIYSGVHYPLDILGGATLGWGLGFLFFKMMMFVENHFFIARFPRVEKTSLGKTQSQIIYLVFVVLVLTVVIATSILHHYNYL